MRLSLFYFLSSIFHVILLPFPVLRTSHAKHIYSFLEYYYYPLFWTWQKEGERFFHIDFVFSLFILFVHVDCRVNTHASPICFSMHASHHTRKHIARHSFSGEYSTVVHDFLVSGVFVLTIFRFDHFSFWIPLGIFSWTNAVSREIVLLN